MKSQRTIKFARDRDRFNAIEMYTREHLSANLHTASVARQFRIGRTTLEQLFREFNHTSYRQYVEEIRLTTAFRLLQEPHATVKEVMYACGYTNRTTFNNAFKKKYGYSPGYFRK